MEYVVRFVQVHETFRIPELKALAYMAGVEMEILDYQTDVRTPTFYVGIMWKG